MARILIVDDEEMDRLVGRSTLEDLGHELLFAPDGEVALMIYQSQHVDVVITDLAMPQLNGFRLIREILAADSSARIIAVTGVSPEMLPTAEELGAVYTMHKPIDPQELVQAVDEALVEVPLDDPWW